MVCICCGKEIPEESTFCLYCGKSPFPKQPPIYSTRTLVFTVALTAGIAILGIGLAFMSNPNAQGATTVMTTPQPSSGIAKPSAVTPPRKTSNRERVPNRNYSYQQPIPY